MSSRSPSRISGPSVSRSPSEFAGFRYAERDGWNAAEVRKLEKSDLPELNPAVRAQLEAYRAEHADEAVGNVGNRLLFEDDRVRIWDMRLEPGEGSDLHRHGLDYYLVMLQGDAIGGVSPESEGTEPFAAPLGGDLQVASIPRGSLEWSVNVGKETFYEIVIELKDR